jgi:hypothetical protein
VRGVRDERRTIRVQRVSPSRLLFERAPEDSLEESQGAMLAHQDSRG